MSWTEATTGGRTWAGSQRTAAACSVRVFILKPLLRSCLIRRSRPNLKKKKKRQKRMLTAVFLRQNINSRTSRTKFPLRGESLHLCPVTPRTTFASFPGLSLLSSAHALRQSERSRLSETTPPPRAEVWVSPESTEQLFLQHS